MTSRAPVGLWRRLCVAVLLAAVPLVTPLTAGAATPMLQQVGENDGGFLPDEQPQQPNAYPAAFPSLSNAFPPDISSEISPEPADATTWTPATDPATDLRTRGRTSAPATATNGLCTGWWYHPVSNVQFRRIGGRLYWDFYLTNTSRSQLGWLVTVSMPFAYVNGRPINPPYGPHARPNWYDFHGSLLNYNFIGGGGATIRTGDAVTLFWTINGSTGSSAYRYTTCRVV